MVCVECCAVPGACAMLGHTGMPRVGHSVTWSDREVSVLSPPVPHILVNVEGSALSRLDRYFDPQPPPRPEKPVGLLPKPSPAKAATQPAPVGNPPPLIDGAACKTSTWTYKQVTTARNSGVSDSEKGVRFRPERAEIAVAGQRLVPRVHHWEG